MYLLIFTVDSMKVIDLNKWNYLGGRPTLLVGRVITNNSEKTLLGN